MARDKDDVLQGTLDMLVLKACVRIEDNIHQVVNEVTYGLYAAHRLGDIDDATDYRLDEQARMVAAPLYGLIRKNQAELVVKSAASIATLMLFATTMLF